jgi:hypothetical protein
MKLKRKAKIEAQDDKNSLSDSDKNMHQPKSLTEKIQ